MFNTNKMIIGAPGKGINQNIRHKNNDIINVNESLPYTAITIEKATENVFNITLQNEVIQARQSKLIVKLEDVIGSFESCVIHTDNPDLLVDIELYGEGHSVHRPPLFSANLLLQLGLGLSAGEVKQNPDGTYPDPAGRPHNTMPYLIRYRPTVNIPDILGDTSARYTMVYAPSPPHTFTYGAKVALINKTDSDAKIYLMLGMIHYFSRSALK